MAKVLSGISLGSPATPLSQETGTTFSFAGTPTFTGTGGVQRYDLRFMVNPGTGYVPMSAATGLSTAATNPIVNTNSAAQQLITVTCVTPGTYTIRMEGASTTGGAYTVLSPTQTIEVTAPAVPTDFTVPNMDAGAPVLASPTLASIHALAIAALATGAVEFGQPAFAQAHALQASEMAAGAPVLGSPTLSEGLLPTEFTIGALDAGAPVLGQPSFAQSHAFSVAGFETGVVSFGAPGVGQTHEMGVVGLTTGAVVFGQPALDPPLPGQAICIAGRCRRLRLGFH